jgi:glycosyltransferase involved in cell wall biosynthesis
MRSDSGRATGLRVLGVSAADVSGWREGGGGKWAPILRALDERVAVVDVITPSASRFQPLHAGLGRLRRAVGLGTALRLRGFAERTEQVEEELDAREGSFDVVFQLQTLFAPGTRPRPYVIYSDATNALLERHGAALGRIPPDRAREWQRREQEVARGARFVFTYSEFARRSFVEDYGCAPERVITAGAGAHLPASPDAESGAGRPTALFVGMDFERKGGPVLLEAWQLVERELPDAELLVAGPRRRIPSAARNVRWLGRVGREEVAALYRSATVFVLPSLYEPFGLVVLEAMSAGLPVVASDCCALPELVEPGVTGELVEPGSPDALAAALVRLLADPWRAAEQGRAGRERLRARHTWSRAAEKVAAGLEAAVAEQRART